MKKIISVFLLILISISVVYSQEVTGIVDLLEIQKPVKTLEKRINKLIRRSPILKNIQGLKQYHVFHLYMNKMDCVDYLFDDVTNIKDLMCWTTERKSFLFFKKKQFLRTSTIICDSLGNVLATADWKHVFIVDRNLMRTTYKDQMNLVNLFMTKKLSSVFTLGSITSSGLILISFTLNEMFGINRDSFFLLDHTEGGDLELVPLDGVHKRKIINQIKETQMRF